MWSAVIVTDTDGTPLGEVQNLDDRKIGIRLRRATTCSFTVPLKAKMADALRGDVVIKLYETDPELIPLIGTDTIQWFSGPVQSAQEVASSQQGSLAVIATSPSGELEDRLCGKSLTGVSFPQGTKRAAAAVSLLATTNQESPTLLRPGAIGDTAALPAGGVGPWQYKPISEAITALSSPLDGFDWLDRPVEPGRDALGPYCGLLDVWAAKGQRRPNAIFEYGTGRGNISSYAFSTTRVGMLNQAFSLPPGFPDNIADGDKVLTRLDTASRTEYRLREQVIASDLTVAALRQQLIDEHVRVRKQPRQLITMQPLPHGRQIAGRRIGVPRLGVDYDFGDIIEFRAVKYGRVRFDGLCRLYGADIALSKTGVATITPILDPST